MCMSSSSTYHVIDTLGNNIDSKVLEWRDTLIPESHEVFIISHVLYNINILPGWT